MDDWMELKNDLKLHLELDTGLTLDPAQQDDPACRMGAAPELELTGQEAGAGQPAAPKLELAGQKANAGQPAAPAWAPELLQAQAEPLQGGWFDNDLLFDSEGHLTDGGLQAMCGGRLDELGSLDAAEHLTFCDRCLMRYTAMLESGPLLAPAHDPAPKVQRELQMRSFRIFTNRYITVAAAVVLAFALWNVGVFQMPKRAQANLPDQPPVSISQLFSGALQSAQDAMGGILGGMQSSLQSGLSQLSDFGAKPAAGGDAQPPAKGGILSQFSNLKGE